MSHRKNQGWAVALSKIRLSEAGLKCLDMSVIDALDYIIPRHCPLLKIAFTYNDALQNTQQAQPFKAFVNKGSDMSLAAPDNQLARIFKGV